MMNLIPLAFLPEGSLGVVYDVSGGRGLQRRLADLGVLPNAEVRVVKSAGGGPILIVVKGSRIALGRGVSMRILVRRVM